MARLSKQDRHHQIVEAACAVIIEKGLAHAVTRDVTQRLNVGAGLLHHYFASWQALRAEAVRTFVHNEITQAQALVAETEAARVVPCFIDWLAQDDDLRHWNLWLNAINEARTDPVMAHVVAQAHGAWHRVIADLLVRVQAGVAGAICVDTAAAAIRLSALIDGLAGIVLIGAGPMTLAQAKAMLRAQFAYELAVAPGALDPVPQ